MQSPLDSKLASSSTMLASVVGGASCETTNIYDDGDDPRQMGRDRRHAQNPSSVADMARSSAASHWTGRGDTPRRASYGCSRNDPDRRAARQR